MQFNVQSSPHIRTSDSVPKIMTRVIIALLPACIYSVVLFGNKVLILYFTAIITCILCDVIVSKLRKREISCSAPSIVTAILLVMTLPPGVKIPTVIIGSVVAIVFAREVFGGLGANVFNPALVGRAFLQAAFPDLMSIYTAPVRLPFGVMGNISDNFADAATSATSGTIDLVNAMTQATPLSFMKYNYADNIPYYLSEQISFEAQYYPQLLLGNTGGAIGETSALFLIIGAIFLLLTNTINWRIPVGMIVSLTVINMIMLLLRPGSIPTPLFQILTGGFALGSLYMATDMATIPNNNLAIWVYSLTIGAVLIMLRTFGHSPEYMMYSILIGNMLVPLLSMFIRPKTFGKKEAILLAKEQAIKEGGK